MLSRFRASGVWQGTYRYPEARVLAEGLPVEVPFTMHLKETLWGLTGSVTEDPAGGFPETGEIDGSAGLTRIRLRKRMPVLRFWSENTTITFNEWVKLTYGPVYVGKQLQHPVIRLRGRLSRWNGEMGGSWVMPAWALGVEEDPDWRWEFVECSGEWSAVRTMFVA